MLAFKSLMSALSAYSHQPEFLNQQSRRNSAVLCKQGQMMLGKALAFQGDVLSSLCFRLRLQNVLQEIGSMLAVCKRDIHVKSTRAARGIT